MHLFTGVAEREFMHIIKLVTFLFAFWFSLVLVLLDVQLVASVLSLCGIGLKKSNFSDIKIHTLDVK